ncbi:MAG: EamA family transporter, partial [Chryseobacterium sp.]|nr:EamA family transporter [Candidatus Chryseobacterium enterohippi]
MEKKNILKGVLFVGLGASIYGMLATFVKMSYKDGFTTSEVTTSQFVLGFIGLLILNIIQTFTSKKPLAAPSKREFRLLLLAGTSLGCTSLFYYIAVQYINVSIAIVLLMQSVWFSVVVESFIKKKFPNLKKIIATVIVLFGSVLATNVINMDVQLDWHGVFWGVLAAASFTMTMFTSNTLATQLPVLRKSIIMLTGGAVIVFLFLFFAQIGPLHFEGLKSFYLTFTQNTEHIRPFDYSILWTYGFILALFGTIIPPVLFNLGFPNTGLGLGSIISSLELPVSVTMAFVLLGEKVILIQWVGIVLILFAIVLMN